jgi:metal-responsive CopG/Arc/MetJ family transcriptional regulator
MAKSTHVNVKTPKKRAAVTGDLIGVRIQPEMAQELDDWRRKQADLPNRPEAIRRLVEMGLKAKGRA